MLHFKKHFEWVAFLSGLILMARLDPYASTQTWCLFEIVGFPFCFGDGLGHSIAFLFRGEIESSLHANLMGPPAVLILGFRIISIWKSLLTKEHDLLEVKHV